MHFVLVIHTGAIDDPRSKFSKELEETFKKGMKAALKEGYTILKNNGTHLDAVQATLVSLENNPAFNSGVGAKITEKFQCELDSSIMDGSNLKCGAVAAVQRIKNPIKAARCVMEKTRHVLLVGPNADDFAEKNQLDMVPNQHFMTQNEIDEWKDVNSGKKPISLIPQHETCGALALDANGNLCAGTSTGGIVYKMAGRVGDSPIIGAGNYANNDSVAVSCTGLGENMIRHSLAFDLRARMVYKGLGLKEAGKEIMEYLEPLTGGYISLDKHGNVDMPFNSPGMARGYVDEKGIAKIYLFKEGEDYLPSEFDLNE